MSRKATVWLLFQFTRSLRLTVLTICCVACTSGISLSQGQTSSSELEAGVKSAVISIPTDGEFYFGKVRVAEAELPDTVKQALKDKPAEEQIVYVKAAGSVRYGTVVSVIDAIRAAGFDRIGLVADKKKHPDVKSKPPVSNSSGSSATTSSAAPAELLIDVMSRTRLKLNSQPMLLSRLRSQLQELLDSRSDKTVFIRAPRKMNYGDVVVVIDIAKGVGAQPIGLQVDQLQ